MLIFFTLISIISIISVNSFSWNEKILAIPYKISSDKQYIIDIDLGTPSKTFNFTVDISYPFTWICFQKSKLSHSTSARYKSSEKLTMYNHFYKTSKYTEYMKIKDHLISIRSFYINILNVGETEIPDSIGMGYELKNDKTFWLSYLYRNYYISGLTFGFVSDKRKKRGVMYVGGLSQNTIEEKNLVFMGNVYVSKKAKTWGSKLVGINISLGGKSKSFDINKNAYFITNDKAIYVDNFYFDSIYDIINEQYICHYDMTVTDTNRLICNCKMVAVHDVLDFQFVIGSYKFTFDQYELFEIGDQNQCYFLIEGLNKNKFHKGEGVWMFGTTFINKYPTFFDFKRGMISFYSRFTSKEDLLFSWTYTVLLINMILVIVISVYLIVLKVFYIKQ